MDIWNDSRKCYTPPPSLSSPDATPKAVTIFRRLSEEELGPLSSRGRGKDRQKYTSTDNHNPRLDWYVLLLVCF